jgi:hypothetical protein
LSARRSCACSNATASSSAAVTSRLAANQDTFLWGSLKGVGKVYVQVVVGVFCSLAFAEVYIWRLGDDEHEREGAR